MTELPRLTDDTAQAAVHELVRLLTKISGPKIAAVFRDRPDKRLLILQSVGRELRAELGPRRANAVMELGALLNGLQVGTPGPGERDEAAEIEEELRAKLAGHGWPDVYRLAARAVVAWHLGFRARNLSLAAARSHPWEEEVEGALARARSTSGPSKKTKAKLRNLARVHLAGSVGATLHGRVRLGWWVWWPDLESISFSFDATDVEAAKVLVTAAGSRAPDEEVMALERETVTIVWEYRDCMVGLAEGLRRGATLTATRVKRIMDPVDPDDDYPERDPLLEGSRRELDRDLFRRLRETLAPYRAQGMDHLRWVYSKRTFAFTRFERALDYLACHAPPRSKLVHADIFHTCSAWVQVLIPRRLVFDPVLQDVYESADYYEVLQPDRVVTYTRDDALRELMRAVHYGPWDSRLWLDDEPSRPTESELRRYCRILNEVH